MSDVVVVETAEHMDDGVSLTDVAEEFVSQSLALAGALHESGDVYNLACCRHDASRVYNLGELGESLVGHGNHAHVRFYRTEREVCSLCLCARKAVEKSGLSHVWESHDTTF